MIFEKSVKGRRAYSLPECDVPMQNGLIPENMRRNDPAELPELSELDVMRHFVGLSNKNHGVLSGFYPLGSCTMKYNPAINEKAASLDGFTDTHPLADAAGNLKLMQELQNMLAEITGMNAFSLQPSAGAHGELAGLMIMKAYHEKRGDNHRTKILVPDSAHGTNPASVTMAGLETVQIKSDSDGNVDIDDLIAHVDDNIAGLMLTNPSTLGLFEINIKKISDIIHAAGGLLYYDGANLNAIMGISRPGDMGFDVVHLNLHKTFATPHGGGGPGAGPVGVKKELEQFLPGENPDSIGRMRTFYGNFSVMVRAYAYILTLGAKGLKEVSENAVLNANYLMARLGEFMKIAHNRKCMHEFVATSGGTLDIAKRMLDFSVHPPTIYFPLIVKEAMMFEPTETESKQTLDEFVEIMREIVRESEENPENLKTAPHNLPIGRLDDIKAARKPVLKWG